MRYLNAVVLYGWVVLSSQVQAATFVDHPVTYSYAAHGEKTKISFPFVQADDSTTMERINNFLHLTVLGIAPPAASTNAEMSISRENVGGYAGMQSDGVKLLNSGRVLSVGIVTTGANDSIDERTSYEFDSRAGRYLVKEELLTPAGLNALARRLIKERRLKIQKKIRQLQASKNGWRKGGGSSEREGLIELYENCREQRFGKDNTDTQQIGVMVIGEGYLAFNVSACGGRSAVSMDEELGVNLTAEQLKPYLSTYGAYILSGQGNGSVPAVNRYAQIFRGKINQNISITLYLGSPYPAVMPHQIEAKYYYEKYRKVIKLSVTSKGDFFALSEIESRETPKPTLNFKMIGGKLTGQWRGGGKAYSFDAQP
jgi:hypothetical protein